MGKAFHMVSNCGNSLPFLKSIGTSTCLRNTDSSFIYGELTGNVLKLSLLLDGRWQNGNFSSPSNSHVGVTTPLQEVAYKFLPGFSRGDSKLSFSTSWLIFGLQRKHRRYFTTSPSKLALPRPRGPLNFQLREYFPVLVL